MNCKLYLSIIFIVFISPTSYTQGIDWKWAIEAGGSGFEVGSKDDRGTKIKPDGLGNFYLLGNFFTDTFNIGGVQLVHEGYGNPFIAKFDSVGIILWAKKLGNSNSAYGITGTDLAIDASGDVYFTGEYRDTLYGNNGQLISTGASDIFIAKYSSSGNEIWLKSFGNHHHLDEASGIAIDSQGNIVLTGSFFSNTLTFGSTTLTTSGNRDLFVAKFDNNGNPLWAKNPVPSSNHAFSGGLSISTDNNDNIIVTGYYTGWSFELENDSIGNHGVEDVFIAKYSPSGDLQWLKQAGGNRNDYAWAVATDHENNIIVAGTYSSLNFQADTATLNLIAPISCFCNDMFLLKYNELGELQWARQSFSNQLSEAAIYGLDVDDEGNIYTVGNFAGHIRLGQFNLNATNVLGNQDVIVARYNAKGDVVWAKNATGDNTEQGIGIAVGDNGNIYVTGKFRSSSIQFDTTTLSNSTNFYNLFLARLDECEINKSLFLQDTVIVYLGDSIQISAHDPYNIYCWNNGKGKDTITLFGDTLGLGDFKLKLKTSDLNGCSGEDSLIVSVRANNTSLEQNEINSYRIYPNPATNQLAIEASTNKAFQIYSNLGKLAYEGNLFQGDNKVDISGLKPGFYLLKLGRRSLKLIIE